MPRHIRASVCSLLDYPFLASMIAAFTLPRLPADPLLFKEQHALNSEAEGTLDIRCQAKGATAPDGLNG